MSTINPVAQPEKRLYYLDWLRVFIIGGVFVAHALLPFTGGDWLIVSGSLIPIAGRAGRHRQSVRHAAALCHLRRGDGLLDAAAHQSSSTRKNASSA